MKIRLFPPFDKLGGDIVELSLPREMTLREFSATLAERFPGVLDFLPCSQRDSAALLENVFFVTNRENPAKLLHPTDTVRDEDFLQILPPFDGG